MDTNKKELPIQKWLPDATPLIYGCMGLGGGWNTQPVSNDDVRQARQVVEAALAAGMRIFDHADIYTFGKAETVFGRILAEQPSLREEIILQSKCGIRFADENAVKRYDFSAPWIEQSVNQSLQRLNTDYLDVLLLHRPDPLMQPEEVAGALDRLHAAGKVRFFGVSNMNVAQMDLLSRTIEQPLIVNQLQMSLGQHDWLNAGVDPESNASGFASGIVEYCQVHGIQLQAWGCLDQGRFSGRDVANEPEPVQRTAAYVRKLAEEHAVSPEAITLAWLMRHPAHIQPVVGVTHTGRIQACAAAPEVVLSREDWYRLYEAARGVELP